MSPALFTPEKQCYTVLILQIFGKGVSRHESGVLFRKGKSLAQSPGRPACEKSLRARRLNRGVGGIHRIERNQISAEALSKVMFFAFDPLAGVTSRLSA